MYKVTYGVDVVVKDGDPTTTTKVERTTEDPNDPKVIEGVVAEVAPTVFAVEAVRVLTVEDA